VSGTLSPNQPYVFGCGRRPRQARPTVLWDRSASCPTAVRTWCKALKVGAVSLGDGTRRAASAGWTACSRYSFIATGKPCRCNLWYMATVNDERDTPFIAGARRLLPAGNVVRSVRLSGGKL